MSFSPALTSSIILMSFGLLTFSERSSASFTFSTTVSKGTTLVLYTEPRTPSFTVSWSFLRGSLLSSERFEGRRTILVWWPWIFFFQPSFLIIVFAMQPQVAIWNMQIQISSKTVGRTIPNPQKPIIGPKTTAAAFARSLPRLSYAGHKLLES